MRHDTDPTPPEGILRPPVGDLARAWLNDASAILRGDDDRAVIATLTLALDSLALAVRLWIWGDPHTLDTVVLASARDLFGWRDCPHCHEITHPDDWDARGYCSSCRDVGAVECHGCREPWRSLDSRGLCDDCADDDQDRDAYGAPYGGRDDLPTREEVTRLTETVRAALWHGDTAPDEITDDAALADFVKKTQGALDTLAEIASRFATATTPEQTAHGDDLGNPFGGALDR